MDVHVEFGLKPHAQAHTHTLTHTHAHTLSHMYVHTRTHTHTHTRTHTRAHTHTCTHTHTHTHTHMCTHTHTHIIIHALKKVAAWNSLLLFLFLVCAVCMQYVAIVLCVFFLVDMHSSFNQPFL